MKIVNGMLLAVVVALLIYVGINVIKENRYKSKINKLQTEIIRLNDLEPETIKITETEVQIQYKDRTITKEIVKEGYVEFDLARYRLAVNQADSLTRQIRLVEEKVSNLKIESGDDEKKRDSLLSIIDDMKDRINKFKEDTSVIIEDTGKNDIVYIKTRGFTFKPFVGVGYSGQLEPIAGIRLVYYNKYSLFGGSTREMVGVGISRRLSDVIPFTNNTSIAIMGGRPYKKDGSKIFIGLTVDL